MQKFSYGSELRLLDIEEKPFVFGGFGGRYRMAVEVREATSYSR